MRNRLTALTVLVVAALALAAIAPALAEDKAPETAAFAVPNLNDEAVVKSLTGELAKVKGVVSAKADAAGGKFLVTFDPGKTNPEKLTKAVTKIAPEAKFAGVQPADGKAADQSACGKCPNKAGCGGKK
jgi:copper chaperone CopZ